MDKSTTKLMFSSKSNDWATPQSFFDKLNGVFGPFTLDAAASADNYKVANHYTEADNALVQDWSGNRVFLNPPYGRGLKDWIKKAYEEGQKDDTTVVMLIPARTDTKYWHDYVMKEQTDGDSKRRTKATKSSPKKFPASATAQTHAQRVPPHLTRNRKNMRKLGK